MYYDAADSDSDIAGLSDSDSNYNRLSFRFAELLTGPRQGRNSRADYDWNLISRPAESITRA